MTNPLPLVGAAMPSFALAQHRDWLIADQRDLEIQDFALPTVLDGDWRSHTEGIKAQLEGYSGRMGVHAPFWNLTLAAWDLKVRAVVVERFKQTLAACEVLGATHMVIHSPLDFLGAPDSLSRPSMGMTDLFGIIHETLAEIVPMAESIGCTLVIENIYDKSPLMLTDLVRSFNSDHVRQSLDTGHAYINFKQGAPPPDYWARTAGDLLGHVHLQDTDGYADRHWAIGDGEIAWGGLFAALAKITSQPRLILELADTNNIPRSWEWLKAHGLAR